MFLSKAKRLVIQKRKAEVVELVDTLGSGSSGRYACGSSNLPFGTIKKILNFCLIYAKFFCKNFFLDMPR